ncbi:MAG: hypothetical protein NVSMB20_14440 [Bradyrhizobium sp.]
MFVYVVVDGFDLGLGMLFPLFPKKADRDVTMNSVAPVWDGNETWLGLDGGGLMAAFPLAYSVLMPALYTPMGRPFLIGDLAQSGDRLHGVIAFSARAMPAMRRRRRPPCSQT